MMSGGVSTVAMVIIKLATALSITTAIASGISFINSYKFEYKGKKAGGVVSRGRASDEIENMHKNQRRRSL